MAETELTKGDITDTRIQELRGQIDDIDATIVELLNKRLTIGKKIGEIKENMACQVLDSSREKKIMERLSRLNKGPLNDNVLHYIFSVIIAASREIQKPLMVTYLGPEATYTHIAAMNHFGHAGSFVPQSNIHDIFKEVEKGTYKYGVVPVENSIEGAVNHTLDLLFETDQKIVAEKYQTISHALLSPTGNINDIRVVYSHPQPFGQCRDWLRNNLPDVVLEECSSTAHAAKKAASQPDAAAIASVKAAEVYNLQVVASKIEDYSNNVTRFLVIGDDENEVTGNDKTTLMFVVSHAPGALYKTMQPAAAAGVNMMKLESRPTKRENWSYFFIMDIEGHISEPGVKQTVDQMKELCLYFKCLGSYPKAKEDFQEIENG